MSRYDRWGKKTRPPISISRRVTVQHTDDRHQVLVDDQPVGPAWRTREAAAEYAEQQERRLYRAAAGCYT